MTWIGSPNFTKGRTSPITTVILHHMAGTLTATDAVFQDTVRQTSAHYGVGRDGTIHQYVKEEDTAWHARQANPFSIGIENEDLNRDDYTDTLYATTAALVREICQRHGIPIDPDHIKRHRDYVATACPGTLDVERIIREAQNMPDKDHVNALFRAFRGREASADEVKTYTQVPYDKVVETLDQGAEREKVAALLAQAPSLKDALQASESALKACKDAKQTQDLSSVDVGVFKAFVQLIKSYWK